MNDLFSAAEIAGLSGGRRPPAPKGYKLPEKFPSFDRAKRLCIDLESVDGSIANDTGPGWRRDAYICGFAVAIGDLKGNTEFSEYYPLRHKGVQNLDAVRVYDWLATETAFYTGEIVGTNLLYDFDGFQYKDIEPKLCKFRDVQWSEALLDENAYSYQLKALAKKYLGEGKVTNELKQLYGEEFISRSNEIHPGHMRAYGIGDVTLPLRILHEQSKQLRKENLEELFDLECRLLPMLLYMRKIGVRVNLEQAANMNFILAKRRDDAIARIAEMSGVSTDYENFGKPQIMKRIFDKLEIKYPFLMPKDNDGKEVLVMPPDPEDVDAGVLAKWEAARDNEESKPSFRKLWLEEALDHPIGKLILEANTAEKARGTFVDGYIGNNAIGDRVYCEFHPLRKKEDEHSKSKGTITGRFSSSNPNLQNIPTRDEFIGPMCRSMFIADEGCQWWSQDYCIAPQTRVLTANLEWKRADALALGEELIGCDEMPLVNRNQGHRWIRGTFVERISKQKLLCVRIITDQGAVECSTEHRWLARDWNKTYSWIRAKNIEPGQRIAFISKPWEEDKTQDGGYLSGLYDGEGTVWGSFNQLPTGDNKLVLEKGIRLLKERGFNLHIGSTSGTTTIVYPLGGREEILRLLGTIRPVRLLAKARRVWENKMLRSKTTPAAKVIAVEYIGEQETIAIQTDRKTFIAEGFVSHNSQVEYRLMVHYAYELKCAGAEVPRDMYLHDPKTDFHDACAKLMYKEKWNAAIERHVRGEITKEQLKDIHKKLRNPAKNLNFGMGYGMGPPLLAAQLGMTNPDGSPTDEALQIIKDYNAASPWLKALNKCCVDEAEKNEFVTTILKRRGRFILWEPRFRDKKEEYKPARPKEQALIQWPGQKLHIVGMHKALNKKIQGSAADLMKFGMVQMWEAGIFNPGNDITCSLTVHDELNGSFVPSKRGEESRLEVKRIMENCMKFNIPILTSGSVGANWAEAH